MDIFITSNIVFLTIIIFTQYFKITKFKHLMGSCVGTHNNKSKKLKNAQNILNVIDVSIPQKESLLKLYLSEVPNHFLCPITIEIMEDPVINSVGQTYQRKNIQHWFKLGNKKDPKTNQELRSQILIPNYAIKNSIRQYQQLVKLFEKTVKYQTLEHLQRRNELKNHPQLRKKQQLKILQKQITQKKSKQSYDLVLIFGTIWKQQRQSMVKQFNQMKLICQRQLQENLKLKIELIQTEKKYQVQYSQKLEVWNKAILIKQENWGVLDSTDKTKQQSKKYQQLEKLIEQQRKECLNLRKQLNSLKTLYFRQRKENIKLKNGLGQKQIN